MRMDGNRLAAGHLAARADGTCVHLAVQAIAWLTGDEMQRIVQAPAEPFRRLDPGRMRWAIVVAETGDLLGVKLDAPRRRPQLVLLGIGAEVGVQHVFFRALGDFQVTVRPELVEIRNGRLVGADAVAPAIVDMAQPGHLVAALGVLAFAAELARQRAEDRIVVSRLADRLNRLLHCDNEPVARRSAKIVALERRRRRQHDVRMARGRCPPRLVHDDGFRTPKSGAQLVGVLMMVEWIAARPIHQLDVG